MGVCEARTQHPSQRLWEKLLCVCGFRQGQKDSMSNAGRELAEACALMPSLRAGPVGTGVGSIEGDPLGRGGPGRTQRTWSSWGCRQGPSREWWGWSRGQLSGAAGAQACLIFPLRLRSALCAHAGCLISVPSRRRRMGQWSEGLCPLGWLSEHTFLEAPWQLLLPPHWPGVGLRATCGQRGG